MNRSFLEDVMIECTNIDHRLGRSRDTESRLSLQIFKPIYRCEKTIVSETGADEALRVPFVSLQAAFELAVARRLRSSFLTAVQAPIHTPNLVKPLTVWPSTDGRGMDPAVWADPARLDTVRIRAEEALPQLMEAGGVVIAAALSHDLTDVQDLTFRSHRDRHGGRLRVHKLETLPDRMIGASYFLQGDPDGISFAFIRSYQSDDVRREGVWTFGMGDPEKHPDLAAERDRTKLFLKENGLTLEI